MISTSHFYGNEEYPQDFLRRRKRAFSALEDAMLLCPEAFPQIILGAEVLYFPGISESEEILPLTIGDSRCILIEPPMAKWSDSMLDEIAGIQENLGCVPVIAHVDRYMTHLADSSLISRVLERKLMVQVNASYFLNPSTTKAALKHLKQGNIHLIGSDCHNLGNRAPNLGQVRRLAKANGLDAEFNALSKNAGRLLSKRG